MSQNSQNHQHQTTSIAETLPTELYLKIFEVLKIPELFKCRTVCTRWKQIIDVLINREELWHQHCLIDFRDMYVTARKQSRSMPFHSFYRSLYLWSQLEDAEEAQQEFCYSFIVPDEIMSFRILRNNLIAVHKKEAIVYYDANTLKRSPRKPLHGVYEGYYETDYTILVQNAYSDIYLVNKCIRCRSPDVFYNVKKYALLDDRFYYATIDDEIFMWSLKELETKKFLGKFEESVRALGYAHNRLQVLTREYKIYTYQGESFVLTKSLDATNFIGTIHDYNLSDSVDWHLCIRWLRKSIGLSAMGMLRDTVVIKPYGNIILLGTSWGILRIYLRQQIEQSSIFNCEPIKEYNFLNTTKEPTLPIWQIIKIDCREDIDGHTVFVGMAKKIIVLKYKHSYTTFPEVTESQPVKVMDVSNDKMTVG